ncbi:MAG: aspartate aminotransferase family protein [Candidatus Dormibacteraeota bacterium]|nr:aspartate aminotransferase family protein [Candidatus Dormibacteraeota bacterium]
MNAVLPRRWLRFLPLVAPRPLRIVRGEGAYVWDEDDRRYLDLDGDDGAALLGHGQSLVVEAMTRQLTRVTALNAAVDSDARDELVEALSVVTPDALTDVTIVESGTQAVAAAVTAARLVTRRRRIIVMTGAARGPLPEPGVQRSRMLHRVVRAGDTMSVPFGDVEALDAVLNETVAAVIVEPVQVDAGVHVPPDGYLAAAARACRRHDVLLIADEVDTALRGGALLQCTRDQVTPDMLCLGRSLAGGLPIGVVAMRSEVARRLRLRPGWHRDAKAGSPLVFTAAAATLSIVTNPTLQTHAATVGEHFLARLRALRIAQIREVRGRGLMIGLEMTQNAAGILLALQERGILAIPGNNNVIRLMPPLILERRQADDAVETLATAVRSARRAAGDTEVSLTGVASRSVRR